MQRHNAGSLVKVGSVGPIERVVDSAISSMRLDVGN